MSSGCIGDFSSYSDWMFSCLSSIDVFVSHYNLLSEGWISIRPSSFIKIQQLFTKDLLCIKHTLSDDCFAKDSPCLQVGIQGCPTGCECQVLPHSRNVTHVGSQGNGASWELCVTTAPSAALATQFLANRRSLKTTEYSNLKLRLCFQIPAVIYLHCRSMLWAASSSPENRNSGVSEDYRED